MSERKEYGVRYEEFSKSDRIVRKERFFATQKQMDRFIEKLVEKDNFNVILSCCYPRAEVS